MKIKTVQVSHFKHVLDSTLVDIQPDITCLVGKNESGKTAFLEALRRLNPAQGDAKFSSRKDYPAWLEKRHRREAKAKGEDLENTLPVTATFALENADMDAVSTVFGKGVLLSDEFEISRNYANKYIADFEVDEAKAVLNFLANFELPSGFEHLKECEKFEDLNTEIINLKSNDDDENHASPILNKIDEAIKNIIPDSTTFWQSVYGILFSRMPQFFYFSEYSTLPSTIDIHDLLGKNEGSLSEDEHTALALLQLAGFEKDRLLDTDDYETRKRELENVANALCEQVLEYWSTNQDLRVIIDIQKEQCQDGRQIDILYIRIWDNNHSLSLPLNARSSGFQWFFSFLAAFSRYEEYDDTPIIILLDEPGLNLHATAQRDFIHFIEERLSKRCQVIYTTHSPFMIQPKHLERTRLVEDKGRETGSVITSNVLTTDSDTLFPLQAALGYDIAQHLFIAKDNLVVEGPSDFLFMQIISEHLSDEKREGLDERWSIMPLGGADVIPPFVALLGKHLDVTVLVDARKEGHQKLQALAKDGFLGKNRIITINDVIGRKMADIEDLFTTEDYLELYNAAFNANVKSSDIPGNDPIVKRIARHKKSDFNHNGPAQLLLRERDIHMKTLSEETLNNFETLFNRINQTLSK